MPRACKNAASAVAFNAGSDARLAGLPLTLNPYYWQSHMAAAWREGWHDVNGNWGHDAGDAVRPLPRVSNEVCL
jgi:hypothetical protein